MAREKRQTNRKTKDNIKIHSSDLFSQRRSVLAQVEHQIEKKKQEAREAKAEKQRKNKEEKKEKENVDG